MVGGARGLGGASAEGAGGHLLDGKSFADGEESAGFLAATPHALEGRDRTDYFFGKSHSNWTLIAHKEFFSLFITIN